MVVCVIWNWQERLLMNELDMKVEKDEFTWFKVRKLALTARDFIYYFRYCYYQETKQPYSMKNENFQRLGQNIKSNIIDELILRGYGIEEMKEFIEWIFKIQDPVKWNLHLTVKFIHKWLKQKTIQQYKSRVALPEEIQAKRKEEEQFAKYLGEGYFDAQLTKRQYCLGLLWRKKHLTEQQRKDIKQWQKENYDPETRAKLKEWRQGFNEDEFDAKKTFFIELARSRGQRLIEMLREFHREKAYQMYSSQELEKEWK